MHKCLQKVCWFFSYAEYWTLDISKSHTISGLSCRTLLVVAPIMMMMPVEDIRCFRKLASNCLASSQVCTIQKKPRGCIHNTTTPSYQYALKEHMWQW